jgi:hypothetical protein
VHSHLISVSIYHLILLLILSNFFHFILRCVQSPLGNAAGQVIPIVLVDDNGNGIDNLLYLQLGLSALAFIPVIFYFKNEPSNADNYMEINLSASRDRKLKKIKSSSETSVFDNIITVLGDKNFVYLIVGAGAGLGLFNAIASLTGELLTPLGYTDDDAGTAGGLFIGLGLVGAGIAGYLMERYRNYLLLIKGGGMFAFIMLFVFMGCLIRGNSVALYFGFSLLGMGTVPLLPIVFEGSAACTYPLSADIANGLLMTSGQVFGIIDIFLLPYLIEVSSTSYSNSTSYFTYLNLFFCINAVIIFVSILAFNGEDKRKKSLEDLGQIGDNQKLI